ncbi:MAG: GIY-YIG nuclease family protein [Methanomicrobiales archaeon]|nr:GIY-YIG nuclease family protein [Methanomicrobiales archaeon]
MDRGVYALVFRNHPCSLTVGSLGEIRFRRGWHVYVGSARGPGGFARVSRHRRLALSRNRPPRWHIDHLLLSPAFTLRHMICGSTGEDLECALAQALGGRRIPSFGSSDCSCGGHLFYRPADPLGEVMGAMASLGLAPVNATIINR